MSTPTRSNRDRTTYWSDPWKRHWSRSYSIQALGAQRQLALDLAAEAKAAATAAAAVGNDTEVVRQRAIAAQQTGIAESLEEAIAIAQDQADSEASEKRQADIAVARSRLVAKAATVNKLAERAAAIADELVEALRELEAAGSAVSGLTYEAVKLVAQTVPYRGFTALDGSTRQLSLATVQNVLAALEMRPEQLGWGRAHVDSICGVMEQRVQALLSDVDRHVCIALGLVESPANPEGLPGQAPVIDRGSDAVVGSLAEIKEAA